MLCARIREFAYHAMTLFAIDVKLGGINLTCSWQCNSLGSTIGSELTSGSEELFTISSWLVANLARRHPA